MENTGKSIGRCERGRAEQGTGTGKGPGLGGKEGSREREEAWGLRRRQGDRDGK